MIKTLISLAVIIPIFYLALSFGDIFQILMLIKGYLMFLYGIVLSREAIFLINVEIFFIVVRKFLRIL